MVSVRYYVGGKLDRFKSDESHFGLVFKTRLDRLAPCVFQSTMIKQKNQSKWNEVWSRVEKLKEWPLKVPWGRL